MYLKIAGPTTAQVRRADERVESGWKEEWFIFEGKKIKWVKGRHKLEMIKDFAIDEFIMFQHNCGPQGQCSDCSPLEAEVDYIEARIFDGDDERRILFDTFAYLIGDKGDTLERLVP